MRAGYAYWKVYMMLLSLINQFTTKSLYRFLTDRGVPSKATRYIWKSKVPLKINFFLWKVFNNKLQVAQNLIKKGRHGDGVCSLCGCDESVNHVLFECHLAKMIWCIIKEIFHINTYPKPLEDLSIS